jgi:hypothetical protein
VAVASKYEPDTVDGEDLRTVFRAFDPDEFLEWPAWRRLSRILGANGGSYGLSGPRGAGKSWLMLRAIAWAETPDGPGRTGIGLWYPSPSEYNPLAFAVRQPRDRDRALVPPHPGDSPARLARAGGRRRCGRAPACGRDGSGRRPRR